MQKTFFKKIIPSMLIITILATGFFGAFRIGVVNSAVIPASPDEINRLKKIADLVENMIHDFTPVGYVQDKKEVIQDTIKGWVEDAMSGIAMSMTYVTGAILGISGVLFNHIIELTVTDFGRSLDEGVITEGWKIFRDLSNIIIIFALLVIGIATILRMENYGYKKLLGKLIAVAILINFSMFFTNIVIDSSNLLALQFYNTAESIGKGNISDAYLQAFKLGTLYDINTGEIFSPKDMGLNWYQILIVGTLASIMFLIVAFAFFAVSLMFVVRYVALVFLIILSPLAFVGMILPKTQNLASKWWSNLFSYAIFAPVYLLLTWFTVKFINSSAFQQGIRLKNDMRFSETTKSGVEAVGNIPLFLNFAIIIALIIGSLILAKQMGGYGSSTIISWGESARKWGQGMVGGLAKRPFRRAGTFAKAQGGKWAEQAQESEHGFAKSLRMIPFANRAMGVMGAMGRSETKKMEDKYNNLSTANLENLRNSKLTLPLDKKAISQIMFDRHKGDSKKQAEIFSEDLDANQRKEVYLSLSPVNRASLDRNIKERYEDKKKAEKFIDDLRGYLSKEDEQKTIDADKEAVLRETNKTITDALGKTKTDTIKVEIQKARENSTLHKWSKEALMNPKAFEHFTNADFDIITRLGPLDSNNKQYMYEKAKEMDNPPEFFSTPLAKKLYGREREVGKKSSNRNYGRPKEEQKKQYGGGEYDA